MRTPTRVPLLAAALAAAVCLAASRGRGAEGNESVKTEVAKVADGKGNAKAIAGKEELEAVMHLFAPRAKGGYGVGDTPGAVKPDGIEQKLLQLTKKALPKAAAAKEGPALARSGEVTAAIAEIAELYAAKDGKKDPKKWKEFSQEMQKAGKDLAAAGKKGDSAAIFTAAKAVNASCNDCHSVFRD